MDKKQEFIDIFQNNIKRDGAEKLLEYLCSSSSDFFVAPASTRFHGSYEGGLVEHCLNVYHCLADYIERERVKNIYKLNGKEDTIAVIALLHDMCKVNCYKKGTRNVKDEKGVWQQVQVFEYDDPLPFGHGEKSVYVISGFMKMTREEAFAIRYHMGFSGTEDQRNVGKAFELFPISVALHLADMEATYFMERR